MCMSAASTDTLAAGRVAELCHALSDPTRLHILHLLRQGRRCVCELTDTMDAAQSRLSFHLKTLRDAGLVRDRREGRWVYYEIRPEALEELTEALGALKPLPLAEDRGGCCR
jgi:ArsR family transcriptional regulator, arsenate/arsenite/antimonite-responsive transcriptional repressor